MIVIKSNNNNYNNVSSRQRAPKALDPFSNLGFGDPECWVGLGVQATGLGFCRLSEIFG